MIPLARNLMAEHARANGFDYVFFVDSDMQFPKNTLARLLAHDRDVCGVFCNERVLQFDPVGKPQDQSLGFGGSSLVEAASLGCGLLLIRTTVFDRLKRPWFYHRDEEYGEDYNFIRDCKEAGIGARADIDLSFEVSHVGEFAIGWKRSDVGSAPVLDVR